MDIVSWTAVVGLSITAFGAWMTWQDHKRGQRQEQGEAAASAAAGADRIRSLELEERRLDEARLQREAGLRADLSLTAGPRTSRGELVLQLLNRGPSPADNVKATVIFGPWSRDLSQPRSLQTREKRDLRARLESIAGTYEQVGGEPVIHPPRLGIVRIAYEDGNGPQSREWDLVLGEGTDLTKRHITLTPKA